MIRVFEGRDKFVGDFVVIEETDNRIRIDYKEWWKLYRDEPELFLAHRRHPIGRPKYSYRLAAKIKDTGWVTYGWEFDRRRQADYAPGPRGGPGTLRVWDPKAWDIIQKHLATELEADGVKVLYI